MKQKKNRNLALTSMVEAGATMFQGRLSFSSLIFLASQGVLSFKSGYLLRNYGNHSNIQWGLGLKARKKIMLYAYTCRFFLPTNSAQYQSARSFESINVRKFLEEKENKDVSIFFFLFFANILFLSSKHALMIEEPHCVKIDFKKDHFDN